MSKRDEFLKFMAAQVGTIENPPGSNNVPCNTAYYGHPVDDPSAHWCATSIWWGMKEVGCSDLYYDGKKTAYVPHLLEWAKANGQFVKDPQPGDWVLFDWNANGIPDHIGTVEGVGKTTITTLEGNVDDAFKRLIRHRDGKIMGYIRPKWPDDKPMPTPEIVEPFEDVPKSAWYAKAVRWAADNGITSGTDATHFSPNAKCTRAQVVTMLYKNHLQTEKRIKELEDRLLKGGG